jgi:fructuronate reductase
VTTSDDDVAPRLSASTFARARTTSVPGFDRSSPAAIAHIGLGAFARAHLGVYADEMLRIGRPALIRGVSLHSRRVEEQLAPQDCLYTVTEREADCEPRLRVVASLGSVATGPAAALIALCAPTTTLVTLTITEKGYDIPPGDLERPDRPGSAPGLLALALARRRDAGTKPPVVVPLDNVADNGGLLRSRVTEIAARIGPDLAEWIDETVSFPSSVVDRMVPAPTEQDLADAASRLGLVDLGAVATERHRSWVLAADEELAALSPLAEVGVEFVDDVEPYEQRKLWLLNGSHSALAYGGLLAGCATIAEAIGHDTVSRFARRLVDDVLGVSLIPDSLRPAEFAAEAFGRFRNPYLGHTCAQVAADGSRKLPQRFLPVVAARERAGLDTTRFATVAAIWIAAAAGLEVDGSRLPLVDDPEVARLRAADRRDLDQVARVALRDTFDDCFLTTVAGALGRLVREGMGLLEDQR